MYYSIFFPNADVATGSDNIILKNNYCALCGVIAISSTSVLTTRINYVNRFV